eukprot:TRINITY_DN1242_c0_g3_i2.p1 TRINITY_DN1242_c0_g3~~TRINITY_DN1242_c0_g3_i2.p1  ORF type:complete len:1380 (+),score=360.41 TRINITY_DN1242_c0_g3_i2:33-4142(+)
MAMNTFSLALADLRSISLEARKQFPQVKEAAERAVMKLMSLESLPPDKFPEEVARTDDIVRPVFLVFESNNAKLMAVAIPLVQKLLLVNAVSQQNIGVLLKLMGGAVDSVSEQLQVKILQAITSLVSTNNALHGTLLAQGLEISFSLHARGAPPVRSTAAATLPMLISVLFERATTEYANTKAERGATVASDAVSVASDGDLSSFAPCARDSYLVFTDLCSLTSGEAPSFLLLNQLPMMFGLELMEQILSTHRVLFTENPRFLQLLPERVCPILMRYLSTIPTSYPVGIRLLRVISTFILRFAAVQVAETQVLLHRVLKMTEAEGCPDWVQVACVEMFRGFFSDSKLLCTLFENYDYQRDEGPKLCSNAIDFAARYLKHAVPAAIAAPGALADVTTSKFKCLEALSQTQPPQVKEAYHAFAGLLCVLGVANSLTDLARAPDSPYAPVVRQLANDTWPVLLSCMSLALEKIDEDSLSHHILKSFEGSVFSYGTLHLRTPRDAFLTVVCKQAVTGGAPPEFTVKSVGALKTLLNIAHCMGNVLEESWALVLRTIVQAHPLIAAADAKPQAELQSECMADFDVVKSAESSLWKVSVQLDINSLSHLLRQLVLLSQEASENNKMQELDAPPVVSDFCLVKLVETLMCNLHRADQIWDIVHAHFIAMSQHKSAAVRCFVVTSLFDIVLESLTKDYSKAPPADTEQVRSEAEEKMQVNFFEILEEMSRSQFADTRSKSLESLNRIIQSAGQYLRLAWPQVFVMLCTVSQQNDDTLVTSAFSSIHLISSDFLQQVPKECLAMYITAVGAYGSQTSVMNISLTSNDILWNVADFIAQQQPDGADTEEAHTLWLQLFFELKKLSRDERPDVRMSSLATLFKSLTIHGTKFSPRIWEMSITEVLLPLLSEVKQSWVAAGSQPNTTPRSSSPNSPPLLVHHSRDTNQKQWDLTLVQTLEGVVRVFKCVFEQIKHLDLFEKSMVQLLDTIQSTCERISKEVAESAAQMLGLCLTKFAGDGMRSLWNKGWDVLAFLARTYSQSPACSGSSCSMGSPLDLVVQIVSDLLRDTHPFMKEDDVRRLVDVIATAAAAPVETALRGEDGLTMLQCAALRVLERIAALEDRRATLIALAEALARIIYASLGLPSEKWGGEFEPPSAAFNSVPSLLPLAHKAVTHLLAICGKTPTLRLELLKPVAVCFGCAMTLKCTRPEVTLWRCALESFITLTNDGFALLAVSNSGDGATADTEGGVWGEVSRVVKCFLFPSAASPMSEGKLQEFEGYDISLVTAFAKQVAAHSKTDRVAADLWDILDEGAGAVATREQFAQCCYQLMFHLCTPGDAPAHLVAVYTPKAMDRCHAVLAGFAHDTQAASRYAARKYLN